MRKTATHWGVMALLLAWLLPGVIGHDPWEPDEGYNFGVVHNMALTGDIVVPRLAADPFMEKPPVYYWAAAGLLRLFSPPLAPHDAARLATPLFLALALWFTGLLGRETWGGQKGWITPLVLVSAPGLLSHRHLMITDMALLAGMVMACYGLLLARRSVWRGGLWLGTGAGLAFMSKGLLGPGILGLSALLLPLVFRDWRNASYFKGLAAAALFALPWLLIWPIALYLRSPELFLTWLWDNNLGRYLGFSELGPPVRPGYWRRNFPVFTFPLLPLTAWYLWRKRREAPWNSGVQLALVVCLLSWLVLVTASTAQGFYLLPTLPLLALVSAGGLPLPDLFVRAIYWISALLFGLLAFLLWGVWGYTVIRGYPPPVEWLEELAMVGYLIQVGPWRLFGALVFTFVWLGFLVRFRPPHPLALMNWPVGLIMGLGVTFSLYLPAVDHLKSFRGVAADIAQQLPASYDCVADINLQENERGSLHSFAGITTQHILRPDETRCSFILVQTRRKYYPDGMNFGRRWHEIWRGHRPGNEREIFYLFQRVHRSRAETGSGT
ncbi:MAG: glycosyltransferase family 39 protein [Pseudomonadota bacterium]|nr:glycosyltransferase family 39 protein [Pseudomonadota bacterium]